MKKQVRETAAMLPGITLDERMCPADCAVTVEIEDGRLAGFVKRHDCRTWQSAMELLRGIECQYEDIELVKVGSRWAAVTYYGESGTLGQRNGFWADDAAGGWGVSNASAAAAVNQCARPCTRSTKKAAMAAVREERELGYE